MTSPRVAIIIAAKNERLLIGRAVNSALQQGDVEVVVVDDGSTDGTSAMVERCDDGTGRLRLLRFEVSQGPGKARNHGIAHSTAPFICVLDADDYMLPNRIDQVLDHAGHNWDIVGDDLFMASEAEPYKITGRIGIDINTTLTLQGFLRGNLYSSNRGPVELGYLKPIMSRAFLERAGIVYGGLRLGEDFTLYAEALAYGARFKLVAACGYVSVHREQSLSSSPGGADLAALAASDDRLLNSYRLSTTDAATLRTHRNRLINRSRYALMLEAKQAGRWGEVFSHLLRGPISAGFILRETLRLKTAMLFGYSPDGPTVQSGFQPIFVPH